MKDLLIGFSTGCLHKTHERLGPAIIDLYRQLGLKVIELMFHDEGDFEPFFHLTKDDLGGFDYISVHTPNYQPENDKRYRQYLAVIYEKHQEIGFDNIVVHPDPFDNFDLLKEFNLPYAFENMDNRKKSCKDVRDMKNVFAEFNVPMVLDVNHCYSNDPSMKLADELIEAFRDRITQIHLSGFVTFHDPLFETKQTIILDKIVGFSVPIIIESELDSPVEVKKEYSYVKNHILK